MSVKAIQKASKFARDKSHREHATTYIIDNPTEFKMKKGEFWWLDVSKAHSVLNESDIDRVHLVIDVFVNNYMSEVMYGVSK